MKKFNRKGMHVLAATLTLCFRASSAQAMSVYMHYGPHGYMYSTIISDVTFTSGEGFMYPNWYRMTILTCEEGTFPYFHQGSTPPWTPYTAHVTLTAPGSTYCSMYDAFEMWEANNASNIYDEDTSLTTLIVRQ